MRTKGLMVCAIAVLLLWPGTAMAAQAPSTDARSAILIEASSGRVLLEKNALEELPQASTTKITTAILALELGNFKDRVKISKNAATTGGSAIWLEEGEVLTLEQLLYAVLLSSANDAAVAVAEHVGGSEDNFVAMMNRKAREIGALHTHYVNPHGLDDPDHYSCAYDLAMLARYAMQIPKFREIVATQTKVIPWQGHTWSRLLVNKNKLVYGPNAYLGATGVKNGFTTPAGYCLVGSARRKGMELIAVVMDDPRANEDTAALLDYGFDNYELCPQVEAGDDVSEVSIDGYGEVNLIAAQSVNIPLAPQEKGQVKMEVSSPGKISDSIHRGDIVGRINYTLDGETVGSTNLLAGKTVLRDTWVGSVWNLFLDMFAFFG